MISRGLGPVTAVSPWGKVTFESLEDKIAAARASLELLASRLPLTLARPALHCSPAAPFSAGALAQAEAPAPHSTTIDEKIRKRVALGNGKAPSRSRNAPADDSDDSDGEDSEDGEDSDSDAPLPGEEDADSSDGEDQAVEESDEESDDDVGEESDAGESEAEEDDDSAGAEDGEEEADAVSSGDEEEQAAPAKAGKRKAQENKGPAAAPKRNKGTQEGFFAATPDGTTFKAKVCVCGERGGTSRKGWLAVQPRMACPADCVPWNAWQPADSGPGRQLGSEGTRHLAAACRPYGAHPWPRLLPQSFAELNLSKPLVKACQALGYTHPTPIQARAGVAEFCWHAGRLAGAWLGWGVRACMGAVGTIRRARGSQHPGPHSPSRRPAFRWP